MGIKYMKSWERDRELIRDERRRTEEERQRAEEAEQRAEEEKQRADNLQAELDAAKAELARLKNNRVWKPEGTESGFIKKGMDEIINFQSEKR